MKDEDRIEITFAELFRRARDADRFPPFDVERGVAALRTWIEQEFDIVEARETGTQPPELRVTVRGRHELLETLLASVRRPAARPVVLAGESGAGKTTLAAALAEQVRASGDQVWWVPAADLTGLCGGLARVAQSLGGSGADVEAIANAAAGASGRLWRLLDRAPDRWLLVLDGADDPWVLAAEDSAAGVQDDRGWARSSQRGSVVVTSRETDRRMWTAARHLAVDDLDAGDAAQILRDLAPDAGDEAEASVLARRLGGHPLALHLAGTYLGSDVARRPTFAAYERDLAEVSGTVVARAAGISLAGLARHGLPHTRELLQLASCYAPAAIPTRFLPPQGLEPALRGLRSVGLIESASTTGISLHPAVTDTGRAAIRGPEAWHAAVDQVVGAVGELRFDVSADWPRYRPLGRHLLALLGAADQLDPHHLAALVDAAADTARAFNRSGAVEAAATLCRTALESAGALGPEHPAVLRLRHQQAWVVADKGDTAAAEASYRDVLAIRRRVLGDDHPDTLASRHEYAWIATCAGRWPEAEQLYRETLRDSETHLGPDAPATLTTRHELAHTIARQGRLREAIPAFDGVLRDRTRVLGALHPQTLQTRHELAWITAATGDWAAAEDLYRRLLALRLQVLDPDHLHVLLTRHELAWTVARQGRRDEALALYEQVLLARADALGADHPDTETTRRALSELREGRIVDATHLA